MRRSFRCFAFVLLVFAHTLRAQSVTFAGLRSLDHAGAFHGLRQDASGHLYTVFDAQDGLRILKYSSDGRQLLAETALGSQGDHGVALDLDASGNVYVAGISYGQGSLTGTAGTAFPARSGTSANSFVARFDTNLTQQWLSFCGSPATAATGIAAAGDAVLVTGSTFGQALPVTSSGVQQLPASNSSGDGFVESFSAASGTLRYATYLTGANGATAPAAIAADSSGNAYIVGTTTATGFPTASALVPILRSTASSTVSGFLTKLNAAGDGFVFSTFVPGSGLTSVAIDTWGAGSVLVSGDVAPGLFPVTQVQAPLASLLPYQAAVRLSLDGSEVLSSSLLAPGTESMIHAGGNGTSWVFGSAPLTGSAPLLPLATSDEMGNAFALRIDASGNIDRAARFGGLPETDSGYASIPVIVGGIAVSSDGTATLAGAVSPTLSSALLPTLRYDLPLVQAPSAGMPGTVRDATPLSTCSGSACSGGAALLAQIDPNAQAPSLSLAADALPSLTVRNQGTATAENLTMTATGFSIANGCGSSLPAGGSCRVQLAGTGPGSITLQATGAAAFTTQLPATSGSAQAVLVSPHVLDFGIVTADSAPVSRTVTVWNPGNSTQTFVAKTPVAQSTGAQGGNGTPYVLAESGSTCTSAGDGISKVLGPAGRCSITLTLTANTDTSQDGAVTARWTVGGRDLLVTGYTQAGAVTLSSSTIDFGRQYAAGIRAARFLFVSNASDRARTHTPVVSANTAFRVNDTCPALLQPRSVCRIRLDYEALTAPSSDAMALDVDGLQAQVVGETLPQVTLGAAAANPNLSLSTASVSFSQAVPVTGVSSETHRVTITNTGTAPFTLAQFVTGDFATSTDCPDVLPGGGSCSASLTFTPSEPGLRQGLVSVTAGSGSAVYVALSGTATAILSSNTDIDFGEVPVNTPSVQWIKVSQAFVQLTAASSNPNFHVVLVEDTGFGHGEPGSSSYSDQETDSCLNCYLGVQFLPTGTGRSASTITLSAPGGGKAYAFQATGSGVPLTGVILTPITWDYGSVASSSVTAAKTFQLTNGTDTSIATTQATVTGDFRMSQQPTGGAVCGSVQLLAGASCFMPVQFAPLTSGTHSGTLTVATSAGPVSATLSGTGIHDPGIAFDPVELRFTRVPGSGATERTVTLRNTSSGTTTIGNIAVSDAHFSVTSNCTTLAPGATCTVLVHFTAGSATVSASLSLDVTPASAMSGSTSTYVVPLYGGYTGASGGLQIIPGQDAAVNFGAAPVGSPAISRILHVNNTSTESLTLAVHAPREFALTESTCSVVAAGAGCDLTMTYTPLTSGDTTGTVLVEGLASDGSVASRALGYLEGYGQGTSLLRITGAVSPAGAVSFGQVASGLRASTTLTLTNPLTSTTGASITVRRVLSEFPYPSATTCGAPLAPGQSCTVTVTYTPLYQAPTGGVTLPQVNAGTLTIESDASSSPTFISLIGQSSATLTTSPDNTAPIAGYSVSDGSLVFGLTATGDASAPQTVTLTNTGTVAVHVLGLVTQSSFTAASQCNTIVAGGSCTIAISFVPQQSGSTLGSIGILTDGSAALDFISLLGNASPASVTLTPESVDFGRALVSSSVFRTVNVTNTGTAPVAMNTVAAVGPGFTLASASSAADACPSIGGSLRAGASCSIALLFTPAASGTFYGNLSVATSGTVLPLNVALSGVGSQPQLVVTPPSLEFGNVSMGSSATLSVTLYNASSLPVNTLAFRTFPPEFTVRSTCGIFSLQPGSSCAMNVAYTPSTAAAVMGSLEITSSDPASPIAVPLRGQGVQDGSLLGGAFVLRANGASSASATVTQGIAANYALTVTPSGGFMGNVALSCTADTTVNYAYCSVSPSIVKLGTNTENALVTITTVTAVQLARSEASVGRNGVLLCMLPASLLLLFGSRGRGRWGSLLALLLLTTSCGGGGDPRLRYVAPGTYRFYVTASSTTSTPLTESVQLSLVVQPRR